LCLFRRIGGEEPGFDERGKFFRVGRGEFTEGAGEGGADFGVGVFCRGVKVARGDVFVLHIPFGHRHGNEGTDRGVRVIEEGAESFSRERSQCAPEGDERGGREFIIKSVAYTVKGALQAVRVTDEGGGFEVCEEFAEVGVHEVYTVNKVYRGNALCTLFI
jgi:hypothetical protein